MYGVLLLLVIALMSLLITRVATVALTATGMTRASARFQARSALSGVGFTTSESEGVVNHPARRRIIMGLMLAGNVGLVTAVAGLLGGFVTTGGTGDGLTRSLLLVAGLGSIYVISKSSRVDRVLSQLSGRWLQRYTDLDVRDYAALLHIAGDYAVKELRATEGSWVTEAPLGKLRLREEGAVVLGIIREDGSYEGAPDRDTCIRPGETVVIYGRTETVAQIAERRSAPGHPRQAADHGDRPQG